MTSWSWNGSGSIKLKLGPGKIRPETTKNLKNIHEVLDQLVNWQLFVCKYGMSSVLSMVHSVTTKANTKIFSQDSSLTGMCGYTKISF